MHILVTGGAGFIGSNFARHILRADDPPQVTVVDNLTYAADLRNLEGVRDIVNFVRADVTRESELIPIFSEGVDVVAHFAAETHVDNSIRAPRPFLDSNVFGTFVLLELSRRYCVDRFLYVSTDEVYGSTYDGCFKESDPFDPSSPYSASKAAAEMFVNAYHRTYGLNTVITRSSNNYGPMQYPEKLIPKTIKLALEDRAIPIYGSGSNIRDWLFVEDNCRAIELVIEKGSVGHAYNIGANDERSVLEVVRAILSILGKSESLISFVSDRPGHDFRYALDTSKIRSLGWSPLWTFERGLQYTVQWYLENRWALDRRVL